MLNNMNNMNRMDRMDKMDFVRESLETNLFFLRIMKEHLYFASAAFTLKNVRLLPMIMELIRNYDELLMRTLSLSQGIVGPETLQSGDIITPYTLNAEMKTQQYAGLPINTNITMLETRLLSGNNNMNEPMIEQSVYMLNEQIIDLLRETIEVLNSVINNVLSCNMFSFMYPTLLEHVAEETEHYLEHLQKIQNGQHEMDTNSQAMHLEFWNEKMKDHADFLHSFLDPSEPLYPISHEYSNMFSELTEAATEALENSSLVPQVTMESLAATNNIRDYKVQVTMNSLQCKLKAMILPLFSDHILREANHYIKSLNKFTSHQNNNHSNG
jgi:hypothetical protein